MQCRERGIFLEISFQNKNDLAYERLLNDLIMEVFGFSFEAWHEVKVWDDRYESYSVIEDGVMLANVCVFKLDLMINGEVVRAHQIGAVATRKNCRGRGLARILMEHILEKYPDVPTFLFANSSVLDFYPKFGFKRIYESSPSIAMRIDNKGANAKKLPALDLRVWAHLRSGRHSSKVLDCENANPVELFHMMMDYDDSIYYWRNLGLIVVAEQNGNELFIPYLSAPDGLGFEQILEVLPFEGIERIRFGFMPDGWVDGIEWAPVKDDDKAMFVRGNISFPEPFEFPVMSVT